MATAPKLAKARAAELNPALKDWLDRVIVPALVREYLNQPEKPVALKFRLVAESAASSRPSAEEVE
jgi:hypothetical protein